MARSAPHGAIPAAAVRIGLTLWAPQQALLDRYLVLVDEWRSHLRIMGARSAETAAGLMTGALCAVPFVPESGRLADLGSGGGLPGIPIAVLRPSLRVALVEATRKKAAFLDIVTRELGLANVEVLSVRAEDLGRDPANRARYDAVTARALAPVRVLVEYALPLLRLGGVAVLPKGRGAVDEVRAAARALGLLGGEAAVHAPSAAFCSPIVVVRKTAPTPDRYPRRPGIPQHRPL